MLWPIEGMGGCVRGKLQAWLEILGDCSQTCGLPSKVRALSAGCGYSLAQGTQELQLILGTGGL